MAPSTSTQKNLERFSTCWYVPFCCVCFGCCAAEFGISGGTYELPCIYIYIYIYIHAHTRTYIYTVWGGVGRHSRFRSIVLCLLDLFFGCSRTSRKIPGDGKAPIGSAAIAVSVALIMQTVICFPSMNRNAFPCLRSVARKRRDLRAG
jgi:hypothetical protein